VADRNSLKLKPEQLNRRCSVDHFTFKDTSELPSRQTIYGQDRGTTAIEFGIAIQHDGYNMYVLGPSGSGRLSAVEHFIDESARQAKTPNDWCYVFNFKQPNRPKALHLPAGQGRQFKSDMETSIANLRTEIAQLFESDSYLKAESDIKNRFTAQNDAILTQISKLAAEKSFSLQATQQGVIMIVPIKEDGQPLTPDQIAELPQAEQPTIIDGRRQLEEAMEDAFREIRILNVQADEELTTLRQDMAKQVIEAHMGQVIKKYDTSGAVIEHLWAVRDDILEELEHFEAIQDHDIPQSSNPLAAAHQSTEDFMKRYAVNVFVEHEPDAGAPVIVLDLPTYQNLIGRIEHEAKFGVLTTDFTQIISGALHRANGGFLILRAADFLAQPFAWEALKRTLNNGNVMIEDMQARGMSVMATQQLEPEPIPINVKVVMVGSPELYYLLYNSEEDFKDLFRVKADFNDMMERDHDRENDYAAFIANLCHDNDMLHFDASAVGRIVDYGSWLISDQRKLSTTFGQITPIIYESVYFAGKNSHAVVTAADVDQALTAREYRNNEAEENSKERITDGTILLDVEGSVVGQINGLVVITLGDHTFGLPARLTARVFMGRKDVVQIDREIAMTGPIHDKGVLILQGYLGGRYAQDYPLSITATLTFEQNYGGVEGDSASSTELYALLSALSGFPIRQDIAVTGSVNQHGKIQPIGGVTQKVEGFYKICKERGLTGTQGVIIPQTNIHNLMLNDEVVQAVEDGKFHLYAIETIDDGIAILTDQEPNTIHQAVDTRLRQFADHLATFDNRR
jgi:predicted ATP-dependent protease